MKTPKIGKAIAKKFKNWKSTAVPKETAIKEPSASSSKDCLKEPEENILIVETATEQQTPYPVVITEIAINTTTAESCDNSNITTIEDQNIADNVEAIEIAAQEPDTFNDPSPTEPCDAVGKGENQPMKTTHQKQAILAGITGIALLICSIEFYVLKIPVTVAVVVGVVGLMCMSFALYKALKPDTKFEEVKDVEQPIVSFESEDMIRNP